MVIIGRLKSWMPPFQLAKAQIERCLSDRLRILQEKGVLKVCGCGCSMMLAGRSLNITVCGGLLPAFWLFLSVQWLSVLSFLPSGEWKSANVPFTIAKQSFSVQWSQTSPPHLGTWMKWNGGASAKLWDFHPRISLSIWATPSKYHPVLIK